MPKRKNPISSAKVIVPTVTESEPSIISNSSVQIASSSSNGSLDTWTIVAEDGKMPPTPPASPSSEITNTTETSSKENIRNNINKKENLNFFENDSQKIENIQIKDEQKEEKINSSQSSSTQKYNHFILL